MSHAVMVLNESNQCICDTEYKWNASMCIIDCSQVSNALTEETSEGCQCQTNYEWNITSN
jgi:hypothetical protein